MEAREYWTILKRWWWVALPPAIVIIGLGIATYSPPPIAFTTTIRLSAGIHPSGSATGYPEPTNFDPAYFSWLTSEYFVASLSDWVETGAFARAVSSELASQGVKLPAEAVQSGLVSDYVRSQLILHLSAGSADHVVAIARGAIQVLETQNAAAFPQLGGRNASIIALDEPKAAYAPMSLHSRIDLVLRVVIGLGVGILLALIAHYLDPMLRTRADVEQLPLQVIGQIPHAEDE